MYGSKNTSKLRVTGLCEGNSPIIPAQKTSNAENGSIWWRHHVYTVISFHRLYQRNRSVKFREHFYKRFGARGPKRTKINFLWLWILWFSQATNLHIYHDSSGVGTCWNCVLTRSFFTKNEPWFYQVWFMSSGTAGQAIGIDVSPRGKFDHTLRYELIKHS